MNSIQHMINIINLANFERKTIYIYMNKNSTLILVKFFCFVLDHIVYLQFVMPSKKKRRIILLHQNQNNQIG